ncbi:hypothetical protein PIIN_08444 [Serendipita indica DSM 11827]|uniref:Uncharacterized protein n=1 Tax=Serendipita indica (strain DSM 11827) TaxID=1109443 RepID=G4TT49_SERID|nr:hypothetical protein PIIN_08444 [Serendipita indica DSM 11827]
MRHKKPVKKHPAKRGTPATPVQTQHSNQTPEATTHNAHDEPKHSAPSSVSHEDSRPSSPSTNASKTSFVRPSLALTKLAHEQTQMHDYSYPEDGYEHGHEPHEDEPYTPSDPYFTPASREKGVGDWLTQWEHMNYPGMELADPQFIETWEFHLRLRLEQAYPRMCYFFLCDKKLFVLVTLLTLRRMAKAEGLTGRPVGKSKQDRQFVDKIAQCMRDAELRYDKDEEWMTWWRETLLTVQGGLQRGWLSADSPNIVYAKDIMKLYRRFAKIAKRLAEAEVESHDVHV